MITQNDLTFFTNEPGQKLEDRFKKTLKDTFERAVKEGNLILNN